MERNNKTSYIFDKYGNPIYGKPIIIVKECWMASPLSMAKYYGRIKMDRTEYVIVDKFGRDIFQLSAIAARTGRRYAIEPDHPADLCREDFVRTYRKLGGELLIEMIERGDSEQSIKDAAKGMKNCPVTKTKRK